MKNKRFLLALVFSMVSIVSVCEAKKMYPVNIGKGEIPGDIGSCTASLSEENSGNGKDLSLKIEFKSGGWIGEYAPKRGTWTGFKNVKFNAFNPSEKKIKMTFVIKDKNSGDRKSWAVIPFELKPGMNEIELKLEGLKTQEGKEVDLIKLKAWHFSYKMFSENDWEEKGGDEFTVFISNLRLED